MEKVVLFDAIYGDQRQRWENVFGRNGNMKLKIISNTTANSSQALVNALRERFSAQVSYQQVGGNHCSVPRAYFSAVGE